VRAARELWVNKEKNRVRREKQNHGFFMVFNAATCWEKLKERLYLDFDAVEQT